MFPFFALGAAPSTHSNLAATLALQPSAPFFSMLSTPLQQPPQTFLNMVRPTNNSARAAGIPATSASGAPSSRPATAPLKAMMASVDASQLQAQTSLNIFRSYIKRNADGSIDARGVVSGECYKAWMRSRKSLPSCPEKAYQRALSGHLTGTDGRVPFDEEEEEAILRVLRRKSRWECFKHCDVKFGESGFRAKGFHEKAISGEILRSRPKKRAKRAIERLRKLSRLSSENDLIARRNDEDEAEDDDDDDDNVEEDVGDEEEEGEKEDETELDSVTSVQCMYPSAEGSSVNALQMQIPSSTAPLSSAGLSMLTNLVNVTVQWAAQGLPWIQGITNMARTVMLSRGWFGSPDIAKCEELMKRLTARYPGYYIMFHNYTCKHYTERILLQNDEAVRIFGGISSKHGGFKGLRSPPEEIWKILRVVSEVATSPPGKQIYCETKMHTKTGKIDMVEGYVTIDDEHKIIIERGRLIDEISSANNAAEAAASGFLSSLLQASKASAQPQQRTNSIAPSSPQLHMLAMASQRTQTGFPFAGYAMQLPTSATAHQQSQPHQLGRAGFWQ